MTDWDAKSALEWDLRENLVNSSCNTVNITNWAEESNFETETDSGIDSSSVFPGSDLGNGRASEKSSSTLADSSFNDGMNKYRTDFNAKKNDLKVGEPVIGLKLGQRTYFEDVSAVSSSPTSRTRRPRTSFKSTRASLCQVEGCNLDLKSAKDYHRRHAICENHSKSPKVIVAGLERRFCQQCSRFHELSEFDGKKRSCRKRLLDHNARRRRLQPGTTPFDSPRLSSSYFDGRQQMDILFNRSRIPMANPTWPSSCSFSVTQPSDSLFKPAKMEAIDMQLNFPTSMMPYSVPMPEVHSDKILSFDGSKPRAFSQGPETSTTNSSFEITPDMRRALSLLSTNGWGLTEPELTSWDQQFPLIQTSVTRPVIHQELQKLPLAQSENHAQFPPPPSESPVHSLNLQNNGSVHYEEFQSFKEPYELEGFYSSHIN
ncbi:hypothetical protein ACFE04_003135 [Oxalis oulophora]